MMICINETSKNKASGRRQRILSLEGLTPVVDAWFGTHGKRYSMMAAGDINGFVTEACESGEKKLDGVTLTQRAVILTERDLLNG